MTIKELIEKLKTFDESAVAVVYHEDEETWLPVKDVYRLEAGRVAVDWE